MDDLRRERTTALTRVTQHRNAVKDRMTSAAVDDLQECLQRLDDLFQTYAALHDQIRASGQATEEEEQRFAHNEDLQAGFCQRVRRRIREVTTQEWVQQQQSADDHATQGETPTAKPLTQPPVLPATKPLTQPPVLPATQPPAQPTTQPPASPTTKPPTSEPVLPTASTSGLTTTTKREVLQEEDVQSSASFRTVKSTTSSSLSTLKAKEKAKLASLFVLQQKQQALLELQRQQQRLKEQEEMLNVQTQIDAAMARQRVYDDLDNVRDHTITDHSAHVNVNDAQLHANAFDTRLNVNARAYVPVHPPDPFPAERANTDPQMRADVLQSNSTRMPQSTPQYADPIIRGEYTPEPLCASPRTDDVCDAIVTALSLPKPDLTVFTGNLMDYQSFKVGFDFRVGKKTSLTDSEKLQYLYQYLNEEPRDLISGCLYMTHGGYDKAIALLDDTYGNAYKLAAAYMAQLTSWPVIKANEAEQLRKLSCFITRCLCAMTSTNFAQNLNHPETLKAIVQKLPAYLKHKWQSKAHDILESHGNVTLHDLGIFIERASEVANDPVFGKSATQQIMQSKPNAVKSVNSYAIDSKQTNQLSSKCFLCERSGHQVHTCRLLLSKPTVQEKKMLLKEKGLCFSCLRYGHISRNCRKRATCDTCKRRHPTVLHEERTDDMKDKSDSNNDSKGSMMNTVTTQANEGTLNSGVATTGDHVFHAILPVVVSHPNSVQRILTYCFLDNGSDGSFISQELYDQMNLTGRETVLQLGTMHGATFERSLVVEGLLVSDCNGSEPTKLPKLYTRPSIPMCHDNIARSELCPQIPEIREFDHLLPDYHPNVSIGLLIGSNSTLLEPIQVKSSHASSLFAVRYRHGWTVQGPTDSAGSQKLFANRIVMQERCKEASPMQVLNALEKDFNEHAVSYPGLKGHSIEDECFTKLVSDGMYKDTDGHYVVPLPLRNKITELPNNRGVAMSRLLWQTKRMTRDETYRNDYIAFMKALFDKGYCEPVGDSQTDAKTAWYLPHHGTYHPQKRKIRVVFDCSARFMGIALNDLLLSGPDLANSLWGVLVRFRFHEIAFTSDIEAMFHQVRVPEHDRCYLRFLWWDDHQLGGVVKDYQMTVHIFGAASSPSVANFVIKTIAANADDDNVRQTLAKHFYVDDCLRSVTGTNTCQELISNLCQTCQQNGFRLTKFHSNSRSVLSCLPASERANEVKQINLDLDDLPVTRALGVLWNVESDEFRMQVKLKEQPMTRRGVLSVTAAVYDPLGFVAPVVLQAKLLLQDLCIQNVSWDEPLSEEHSSLWKAWLSSLSELDSLRIPRHFFPFDCDFLGPNVQLHAFSDASTVGYGAVVYLRCVDGQGDAHTCFIAGKARVASAKTTTIPRLELTAATVAVRLACFAKHEMGIDIPIIFHTDSQIVLNYIKNDKKRFPIYIANRVRLIREYSDPDQWRFVPSTMNPADTASRGISAASLADSRWLKGPEFLLQTEENWPPQTEGAIVEPSTSNIIALGAESEAITCSTTAESDVETPTERLVNHYSSWNRLRHAVAVFRKFTVFLSKGNNREIALPLNAADIEAAEKALVKWTQQKHFVREIDLLKQIYDADTCTTDKRLLRQSHLRGLNPFLDDDGLIRIGGRLRRTDWDFDAKHPIVLPHKCYVVKLIIADTHVTLGHAGRTHVLSYLRSRYWVIRGNSAVRAVISSCTVCIRTRGHFLDQQMSDLPLCRVTEPSAPFTFVGVDYFGPFVVKDGRKRSKRYGVLFTCLSSRAIHIEVTNSLDTSAFINALRRCMARRGPISELYCDNGTNFVGTRNELKLALSQLSPEDAQRWSTDHKIIWHFNPPHASHMGGVWERCIRSVRSILFGMMTESSFVLDHDSLVTLFCEAENIVNSRPLTSVSCDASDPAPLTPNHLLTMKSSVLPPPPGNFVRDDLFVRKRWRRTQYLVNLFWSRWRKEYLALLQPRKKWTGVKRNLKEGDVVLMKEEGPRNEWPLALVCSVSEDDKGLVRSVTLRSRHSQLLKRPVHKLVLLVPNDTA